MEQYIREHYSENLTLKELAEILGYVDESHISKVFAARLGTRIGQYRATYQKVQNICQIEESRLGYSLVQHICRHYREDLSAAGVARPRHFRPAAQPAPAVPGGAEFEDFLPDPGEPGL